MKHALESNVDHEVGNGLASGGQLPKYVQVSELLAREIASGRLVDGMRLPPEREMAVSLGVSVGTLRKALADLEARGLVERVQGSGNYIRAAKAGETNGSVYAFFRLERPDGGGLPTAEVLALDHLPAPEPFANVLEGSAQAWRVRRCRSLDGVAIAAEEIWFHAPELTALSAQEISESLYLFYRERLGLWIEWAEDQIGVGDMPAWAGKRLRSGAASGFIERWAKAQTGAPMEYSRTWYDPAKARYVARLT